MSLERIVIDERMKQLRKERSKAIKAISKRYKHLCSLYYRVDAKTLEKASLSLQEALDVYARVKADSAVVASDLENLNNRVTKGENDE